MTGPTTTALIAGTAVLAAGTYAFRAAGPLLGGRVSLGERGRDVVATATVVLLGALVATAALTRDGGAAGVARPAGVLVAGVLAWRRVPFVLVVLAAAAVTALLRLLDVP